MKLLHTSDWHLGRSLYGRKRHAEFEAFLSWLVTTLRDEQVEALLIAGDVFDTSTPGTTAQQQYYQFLAQVAGSSCRHVVVIAGNHDSPTFLNAPQTLLRALNVHVIGKASSPEDEVLVLRHQGVPELIVCAVPFLHDRELRTVESGETPEDKDQRLVAGIHDHYARVFAKAEQERAAHLDLPVVAMGHLFTTGGAVQEGEGVRNLYVGALGQVSSALFPSTLNYVALGHLHVPQQVKGGPLIRYSGSPLPMGFGEAAQQKSVVLVDLTAAGTTARLLPIPTFQKLVSLQGDWATLQERLQELCAVDTSVWLEVTYTGAELVENLQQQLEEIISGAPLELLRVKNARWAPTVPRLQHPAETLEELSPKEVFQRCLEHYQVPKAQQPELLQAYQEVLHALETEDHLEEASA